MSTMGESPLARGLAIAALLSVAPGCVDRPSDAAAQPPPLNSPVRRQGPPAPGGCHNESVDGACTFGGLRRVNPTDGSPLLESAALDPGGTVTWAASYAVTSQPGFDTEIWIRALRADGVALRRFYAAHPVARCSGVILRAPCPPGVHVTTDVPPPPVGTVVRTGT